MQHESLLLRVKQ